MELSKEELQKMKQADIRMADGNTILIKMQILQDRYANLKDHKVRGYLE